MDIGRSRIQEKKGRESTIRVGLELGAGEYYRNNKNERKAKGSTL